MPEELDNLIFETEEYNTEDYWNKQNKIWAEKENTAWEDYRDNNL